MNPKSLVTELKGLQERGINTDNLRISNRAHVILPYHIKQDIADEESRGDNKIGTTCKGIGPCYQDKVARIGIRMADLLDKEIFEEKLRHNLAIKNKLFEKFYEVEGVTFEEILRNTMVTGRKLLSMLRTHLKF